MVTVFSGKDFAEKLEQKVAKSFSLLPLELKKLILVDILVGNDQPAQIYLNLKELVAKRVGIKFRPIRLSEAVTENDLLDLIEKLNRSRQVGGIMFQLPLPKKFRIVQQRIIDEIAFNKDVDCLTSQRLAQVISGKSSFLPATVEAVMAILEQAGAGKTKLSGKKVVVVGRSNIIGRPLAAFLSKHGALVTTCHRQTKPLSDYTQSAEIIVSATGQPNLIKKAMVSSEQIIIDVGSPGGDVDFLEVKDKASFITPVPGGVGPVTVTCLLANFIRLVNKEGKQSVWVLCQDIVSTPRT
jgi:methylenetetrahydrofolate dehydrogenase (NADP+) / methenyltetrahydrofolate cyclohydrolase